MGEAIVALGVRWVSMCGVCVWWREGGSGVLTLGLREVRWRGVGRRLLGLVVGL